jgi:hypothetical protein
MQKTKTPVEYFSEEDVADLLDISLACLHRLLDEHIFNDGSHRPQDLTFTHSELTLLRFWSRSEPNPKILRMPRRH